MAIAIGGVANTPPRLPAVESALVGQRPTPAVLEQASELAPKDARPLPMTGYKVGLVRASLLEALERATSQPDRD